MPPAPATPSLMPNPKSILSDRNHNATDKMNDHNSSPRVTFVTPQTKQPQNNPGLSSTVTLTNSKPGSPSQQGKQIGVMHRSDEMKSSSEKSLSHKSKKSKPKTAERYSNSELIPEKKSEESIGNASKRSTGTRKGTKSKKYIKSGTKTVRNLTGAPKRLKSSKRVKRRSKDKSKDMDLEDFKPAKLNEEYASELNRINEILRAVSTFDATTATGAGTVNPNINRVKMSTTVREGFPSSIDDGISSSGAPRRPLSADELKQLLSSITRVVSLHQLPLDLSKKTSQTSKAVTSPPTSAPGPTSQVDRYAIFDLLPSKAKQQDKTRISTEFPTFTSTTSGASRTSKKKAKKVKESSHPSGIWNRREVSKTKSKSSNKSKSRVSLRKSRSKQRDKNEKHPGRPYSEGGSSVSSAEKDPVQNAAFLRKYFEESTRLANRKSSEELNLGVVEDKPKKRKVKKKKSSMKKSSTKSVVDRKSSSQSVQSNAESVKSEGDAGASTNKQTAAAFTKDLDLDQQLAPAIKNLFDSAVSKISPDTSKRSNKDKKGDSNRTSLSDVSSTLRKWLTKRRSSTSSKRGLSETKLKTSKTQHPRSVSTSNKIRSKSSGPQVGTSKQATAVVHKPLEQKSELIDSLAMKYGRENYSYTPAQSVQPTAYFPFPTRSPFDEPPRSSLRSSPPLKQFETIEDVINSKFSGDTSKMKSIWDKTPYQPMTHERFKDLVSKYADGGAVESSNEGEQQKQNAPTTAVKREFIEISRLEQQRYIRKRGESASKHPAPGPIGGMNIENLLSIPKSWEREVKVKPEPTITQIQSPPKNWVDYEKASTYNQINVRNQLDTGGLAERARQRLHQETTRHRRATMRGPVGGPYVNQNSGKEFDIFKLYKDAMRKNTKYL